MDDPSFFVSFMDVPHKKGTRSNVSHYATQLRKYVLEPLHDRLGVDISEEGIRAAVAEHNEVCRIISEIGEFRKLPNPPITGYEFHVINLVTMTCPKYLILDKLRETLEEIRTREPDAKPAWKIRAVLSGSENDDPEFTRLIESCGALVVADRHCYGSLPGREPIELEDGEPILETIARHYLDNSQCPRYMNTEVMHDRKRYLKKLYDEYHADGVIIEQMKFCEYWSYERVADSLILTNDYGIPWTSRRCTRRGPCAPTPSAATSTSWRFSTPWSSSTATWSSCSTRWHARARRSSTASLRTSTASAASMPSGFPMSFWITAPWSGLKCAKRSTTICLP